MQEFPSHTARSRFRRGKDSFEVVVQGYFTLVIEDQGIPLRAGDESVIARGVVHGGEVAAGTRAIHACGAHRGDKAKDA